MKRVAIQTLGCKLNQFESDSLATQFVRSGYTLVAPDEEAEAYIINTCTVTGKADRKSRHSINQAQRNSDIYEGAHGDGSLVVVTGCFAESNKDTIIPHDNTYIVGNGRKSAIFEIVDAHMRGEIADEQEVVRGPFDYMTPQPINHTRSALKIQDGCDNYCTFCIIPFVRGRAISRPHDEVARALRETIAHGYKEVVLTGVNMSRYNDDGFTFSMLLAELLDTRGDFRIRISSLEPDQLDERFFALLEHPKMTPHVHLCMQSGSERILLQMRRQYSAAQYRAIVEKIRSRNQYFNITTDVIVGFPGESEEDFNASCAIVEEYTFGHAHVFPYAVRNGTRAERMAHKVAPAIIKERAECLRALSVACRRRYRESLCGRQMRVLTESRHCDERGVCARGYSEYYVPVDIEHRQVHAASADANLASMLEYDLNAFYTVATHSLHGGDDPVMRATAL